MTRDIVANSIDDRFDKWWSDQTECGVHNSLESSNYTGFKGGYQIGMADGYFDAMRHLFIKWRGNACMETRQADRWTWGILCRYLDEQCGVKDETVSGMEKFFGLVPADEAMT